MDRGGLKVPSDRYWQWTVFYFIVLQFVKDVTCRKTSTNIFHIMSKNHAFQIADVQCRKPTNIFFKNYFQLGSPLSHKERALKVLKVSTLLKKKFTSSSTPCP